MKKLFITILSLIFINSLLLFGCSQDNYTSITGEYILTEDGQHILLVDMDWESDAYYMENISNSTSIFDNLKTGDIIEVKIVDTESTDARLIAKVIECKKID